MARDEPSPETDEDREDPPTAEDEAPGSKRAERSEDRDGDAPRPRKKKPRKKKKKRAARAAETEATDDDDVEAPDDAPPPLPGEDTALGDRLREAHRLFDVGDYASVRRVTKEIEATGDAPDSPYRGAAPEPTDADVRRAARSLRRRIDVDPVQVVVLACCAAVLFAIVYHWVL